MPKFNTPEKFWNRVNVGDAESCWCWMGAVTSSGYGNLSWHSQHIQAHRLAYFLSKGNISLMTNFRVEGVAKTYKRFVLHRCDNRLCCNPKHLFLGSMRTNLLDAYQKGRKVQPKSTHANAKLSADLVVSIRNEYARGCVSQQKLAQTYGVSQRAISLIVRNETYKDVK
jgi:Zinc-binding loop region of homing endonuclease